MLGRIVFLPFQFFFSSDQPCFVFVFHSLHYLLYTLSLSTLLSKIHLPLLISNFKRNSNAKRAFLFSFSSVRSDETNSPSSESIHLSPDRLRQTQTDERIQSSFPLERYSRSISIVSPLRSLLIDLVVRVGET